VAGLRFLPTALAGAFVIEPDPIEDRRGFFASGFCAELFEAHGLETSMAQVKIAFNRRRGTLRGMHYQAAPAAEAKLVRCVRGAIHDVIVDMRTGSPTYLQHVGVELTAENRRSLYVLPFFAHGYQTLDDDTEVMYQASAPYAPACKRGHRYNDPAFGIQWPLPVSEISEKDAGWPSLIGGR
jgi:dTDP-4-dehydrorhamnose 3,5-epimerase